MAEVLKDRASVWLFAVGVAAVSAGALLHAPMFLMGKDMGFRLAGMPMDRPMIAGMFMIIAGIGLAGWGLLPRNVAAQIEASRHISVKAPEDAPLTGAHWQLMAVLVIALVIDVMKPAALGFVMPGVKEEYAVSAARGAALPFAALFGTVVGSVFWGVMADIYGRKATIMLSAVMFVGTSICGAMPSLNWNIFMCFLMGAAAGGMLPVTYALLAEIMPTKHRGWALVLVGGLGSGGGYFAASGFSAWLEPIFSWRVLFLLNLPTGLLLLSLSGFIPESAKFLLARGRRAEAQAAMARFGTRGIEHGPEREDVDFAPVHVDPETHRGGLWAPGFRGRTAALTTIALSWGLVNFGLLLWMPADFVSRGLPMAAASRLLAQSALIAFPTVAVGAFFYSRWSTKGSLLAATVVSGLGLVGVLAMDALGIRLPPVAIIALLIVGNNAVLAIVLPYASESYPLHIRGRATGWIAASTKAGGLAAQALSVAALVPPLGVVAALILAPVLLGLALTLAFCPETRGVDLRLVDARA